MFHELGEPHFLLPMRPATHQMDLLDQTRLQRAMGVIYRPETERVSHYYTAHLLSQFDAVIHVEHSSAVEPLDRTPGWEAGEVPETYPSGL